jgi:hypothetical protein
MEYKSFDALLDVADVHGESRPALTRAERLERWAQLLERDPARRLRSLGEIESRTPAERLLMRSPDSPLTIAFEDPVLRSAGLASDRLGDGMSFFEISEDDAHRLMCSCLNGWSMSAGKVARGVRRIARPRAQMGAMAVVGAGAVVVAAPVLAFLFG